MSRPKAKRQKVDLELLLVCRLGLDGVNCFRCALNLVPHQYLDKRFKVVSSITNKVITFPKAPITPKECCMLSGLCSRKAAAYMKRECTNSAYADELWELTSESVDLGYATFLAPPTTVCLQAACDNHHLCSYTAPVKVTVYDMMGPSPASKISLRCPKCKTNYNYSMYGNKSISGERYYDQEREYIEVSDVVFVSRVVHNLFAALR